MGKALRHPPPAFVTVCGMPQYPFWEEGLEDMRAWAHEAVKAVAAKEKPALKRYLDDLLAGSYTNAELKGLVNRSLTDYGFNPAGARWFLETLRAALERDGIR